MRNQLGEASMATHQLGGQLVRLHPEAWIGFVLEHGLYRRAGKNRSNGGHWPEKVAAGELDREGLSLNWRLYRK